VYLYLIFNTLIALDWSVSFTRNFGFIRLIIFFIGVNYFFSTNKNFDKIFIVWSVIILIVVFDVFIEKIFGSNILGYGFGAERVVSFFKDEEIPGGFIYAFTLMLFGYYLLKLESYKINFKILILILFFIVVVSIISTGERSNSIRVILSFLFFLFLYDALTFKKKIIVFFAFFFSISVLILSDSFIKHRMFDSILYASSKFKSSFVHDDPNDIPGGNIYAKLYKSSYVVFKNYPLFGVGNKNYRIVSCYNKKYEKKKYIHISNNFLKNNYVCSTHPHQIYFELLAEHGLIGSLILLSLFFTLFFKMLKITLISKNYIGLGCLSYLIVVFTPILPSGAFFADYNITLFFINLSIMNATNKNYTFF